MSVMLVEPRQLSVQALVFKSIDSGNLNSNHDAGTNEQLICNKQFYVLIHHLLNGGETYILETQKRNISYICEIRQSVLGPLSRLCPYTLCTNEAYTQQWNMYRLLLYFLYQSVTEYYTMPTNDFNQNTMIICLIWN